MPRCAWRKPLLLIKAITHRNRAEPIGRSGLDSTLRGEANKSEAEAHNDDEHGQTGDHVADTRRTDHNEHGRERDCNHGAFPERVEQCPADRVCQRSSYPVFEKCHDAPSSYFSSNLRSSANSAFEALRAESAPIMRLLADPLKARCSKSPAICRCVHSRGRAA